MKKLVLLLYNHKCVFRRDKRIAGGHMVVITYIIQNSLIKVQIVLYYNLLLFRNKRFMLDEMVQQNASKFVIF